MLQSSSLSRTLLLVTRAERQRRRFISIETRHGEQGLSWRPAFVVDEWVNKEARPISIRQLMVFGRTLTESRLIKSANYVQTELPIRLAHRIRDMQTLPYIAVKNPHVRNVYELYYKAFESLCRIPQVMTLDDNVSLCKTIRKTLDEHLSVIPKLAKGMLECQDLMRPEDIDKFMNTMLRSRISRRVIAEQHLALARTFPAATSPSDFPTNKSFSDVFFTCSAFEVINHCQSTISTLCSASYGPSTRLPEIRVNGHLTAKFHYIRSHLEYIIGELLRNSIQATVERHKCSPNPPPIEVTICEAPLHIIIRVSDRGGGIDPVVLPYLWSFSKGPRSTQNLRNLSRVPKMAATLQELSVSDPCDPANLSTQQLFHQERPSNLRLGMGLPLSRVYAEYWAGSIEVRSLDGYGVDAFLRISKLGNHNEQVTTRAIMDAI